MANLIHVILAIPVLLSLFSFLNKDRKLVSYLTIAGISIELILGLLLTQKILQYGPYQSPGGYIYLDALSMFFLNIIFLVGWTSSLYSRSYMEKEVAHGVFPGKELHLYYGLFHLFILTMMIVVMTGNIAVLWISIEATTLASAFLVGFYNKSTSVEAAWKYVILCSVGISFALFGILLLAYAQMQVLPHGATISLNWVDILGMADKMDKKLLKLAFIFIFVGFGTKAGLAPMHSWLPDAHSQAPTPVSALLSGVLLKCAFYGLIRTHLIVSKGLGTGYTAQIFLIFGLLSIIIAAFFIVLQKDIKRLLAYSSLEHIGIISLGIGFGGWFGIFGTLFHILNHAITKSLMFFTSGNIAMKYQTKQMRQIKGVMNQMPMTGGFLILGTLALGGTPLCGIFVSEISVLIAGIHSNQFIPVILLLAGMAVIFAGLAYHLLSMAYGAPKEEMEPGDSDKPQLIAISILAILVLLLGIYIPSGLQSFLEQCIHIMNGGQ